MERATLGPVTDRTSEVRAALPAPSRVDQECLRVTSRVAVASRCYLAAVVMLS